MKTVADFIPWVEPKVASDTSRPLIEHAIREALHQFLWRSRAAVSTAYVPQTCRDYEVFVELDECHRLIQIEGIYIVPARCGVNERLWSPRWEMLPQGCNVDSEWQHDMADGDRLTVYLEPDRRDRVLAVRYSWTFKRDHSCAVPDWIYEDHVNAIADYALAYLHRNPVDTEAAAAFANYSSVSFDNAVDAARSRKAGMYGGAVRQNISKAHFFGG